MADGVRLDRPAAATVLDPPGPLAVQALRIDPSHARLAIALAEDATPARQPVPRIASAHGAIAAVNASFFDRVGRQVGLLKAAGEMVSTGRQTRGAVAWSGSAFVFDRVRAAVSIRIVGRTPATVAVDHVNPSASRAGVSLYTASFTLPVRGRQAPPTAAAAPVAPGTPVLPPSEDETEAAKTPRWSRVTRWSSKATRSASSG